MTASPPISATMVSVDGPTLQRVPTTTNVLASASTVSVRIHRAQAVRATLETMRTAKLEIFAFRDNACSKTGKAAPATTNALAFAFKALARPCLNSEAPVMMATTWTAPLGWSATAAPVWSTKAVAVPTIRIAPEPASMVYAPRPHKQVAHATMATTTTA